MTPPGEDRSAWPFLPALLWDMADSFGLWVALAFAERHGGTIINIPVKARPEHPLAREFGLPVLRWLVQRQAASGADHGGNLPVPRGPDKQLRAREAAVAEMSARGMKRNEIARALGINVRTVSAIRARQKRRAAYEAERRRRARSVA